MSDQERFWSKVDKSAGPNGCWIWMAARHANGYGRFYVGGRANRRGLQAHRFALGVSDIGDPRHVLHSCDNPPCVNPAHLRFGDHAANMRDMASRGRSRTTRLSEVDVRKIRKLADWGLSQAQIARDFGVSKSNVQAITSYATWRHVA